MCGRRVGIIGAGFVGATAAYTLAMMGTCHEVILYDIVPEAAQGKAIDIAQATVHARNATVVSAAETPAELEGCDVVVITAGVPRKGDMTRADLLMINSKIMLDVIQNVKTYSPNAIVICVSNPLDVMTYVIHKLTGWDKSRIMGMAGALDGSRMAYQIQKKVGYGRGQTRAIVIGDHGQNMIPMPEISAVGGVPLTQILNQEEMDEISRKTSEGGAEIVGYLGTSAYYAPGRSIAIMVEAILDDLKMVMPSSVMLEGEYGYSDVCVGVPVVIGKSGVEKIIELDLNETKKAKFAKSVESIQENIAILKNEGFFEKHA